MEDTPSELTECNLEEFLYNDNAFVDYFNTFLSLPCFPERIFYNRENDLLEQFTQQLIKDESNNVQLKYDSSSSNVQISYCVTILEKDKALEWLKKYRLSEFIKSGLYAEYKLSKTLSSAQAMYIDTIKNDLSRSSKLTEENSTLLNEEYSFSSCDSVVTTTDECEAEEIDDVFDDYVEDSAAREVKDVHENKAENFIIFNESVSDCLPAIIVSEVETNSDGRDGDETEEMPIVITSHLNKESSEMNDCAANENDSSSDIEASGVKDDVISDDVGRDCVSCDDVMINCDLSDGIAGDDVPNGDAPGVDVIGHGVLGDDVICDYVIDNDVVFGTHDCSNDVIAFNERIDDALRVDANNHSPECVELDCTKNKEGVEMTHPELSRTDSKEQHDQGVISTPYDEKDVVDTEGNSSLSNNHTVTDIREQQTDNKQECSKEKTDSCKCFIESDKASVGNRHDEYTMDNSVSLQRMSLPNITKTDEDKPFDTNTNVSNTFQGGYTQFNDGSNLAERFDISSFHSTTPLPPLAMISAEQSAFGKTKAQDNLSQSSNDSLVSLKNKTNTISSPQDTLSQSGDEVNHSVNYSDESMNIAVDEAKNNREIDDLESVSPKINLSKVEARTLCDPSSNGIIDGNKIPQQHTISDTLHASNMIPSNANLRNAEDHTCYNTSSNASEKEIPQKYTNTGAVENLQFFNDVKIQKMEDSVSHISHSDSEQEFSDRPFMKRPSSSNSIASSVISELEEKSSITEPQEQASVNNVVDLSSKKGMDEFKEFLVNTKGEALFFFWLRVETWKHIRNHGDKIRFLQEIKEQFFRNGSPLELPNELKKRAGKYFNANFSEMQRIIAEPLRCYWCPRFTLHQFKTQATDKIQLGCRAVQKSWSSEIQPKPDVLMYPSTSPHLLRPHSSFPRESLHTSTVCVAQNEGKPHARSKSAHGRIVSTPFHTNAGKKQLEIYATPPPVVDCGFLKRPISMFPPCDDQEYLSPVRLVISPRCKTQSRTAWSQRPENERYADAHKSHQNETSDNTRQDSLVDSLMYPSESGCFFKEFVSKQNNQMWSNCLSFWQAVLDYTAFFESDALNPVSVSRKAQWIYARFITSGSICDIKVDWKTQEDIRQKLDPPYEELFDCVEEHVLACLKKPWDSLCRNERREYDMIPKQETVRFLEVKLKRTRRNSKNSSLQEQLESEDGRDHSERGKYSIEDVNSPHPSQSDGLSFENVIKDRDELEGFQKYLEKKDPKGVMDLMAWTEMETFQRIPRTIEDKRNKKAKEIRQAYLNSRYFFGPDSPATKDAQNLILSMNGSSRIKERPSSSVITECQKYVRCRIERRWLALYKASQEYKEKQNPKQNVSEVVEDIMLRRRLQRSEAAWRVLNSRWVSSSRDIVALRQTLSNPESCTTFRKFVALKGDTYENDVLFWIEIQKYKDLCHRHASEKCIKKKVQAITECFITSSIPPELQVDVPIEMAEKLMERITSRNPSIGPYLFREVQMTVFRVLFNMWKDFSSFRSSINDENLLKVLDKRLSKHRAEVKAKKEASERRKIARQEAERKKKEREEKEKKELKSMEQLMSLMSENSAWEQEENEVVVWKYSKFITAPSESTLRVKKVSTQDDSTSLMELTNQRSVATKSTNWVSTSLRSERHTEKVSKSKRFDSLLADSTYSTHSKISMKESNSIISRIPKISPPSRNCRARDIKRYDIIDKNSQKKPASDNEKKQQNSSKDKLLKHREGKKSKRIVEQEIFDSVSNVGKESSPTEQGNKNDRIKNPTIKDSQLKSRRRDEGDMVTERPGSLQTSVLRRQWNESHSRNKSPVPLTSQLLYDFTNSPEGAPLDSPLSLARINASDNVSVPRSKSSDVHRKTPPNSAKKIVKETTLTSWRTKGANRRRNDIEQFVPDVIVN